MRHFSPGGILLISGFLFAVTASATSVPRLTFEELTDQSELIVSGQITRTWADWDNSHHNIWTHYELAVSKVHKGNATATVILSEPGGAIDGIRQAIADTVQYGVGDKVFVFLERMPNSYLRTTGWAQGKYTVDASGHLHAAASLASGSRAIDGITTTELAARVTARVQIAHTGARQ